MGGIFLFKNVVGKLDSWNYSVGFTQGIPYDYF